MPLETARNDSRPEQEVRGDFVSPRIIPAANQWRCNMNIELKFCSV